MKRRCVIRIITTVKRFIAQISILMEASSFENPWVFLWFEIVVINYNHEEINYNYPIIGFVTKSTYTLWVAFQNDDDLRHLCSNFTKVNITLRIPLFKKKVSIPHLRRRETNFLIYASWLIKAAQHKMPRSQTIVRLCIKCTERITLHPIQSANMIAWCIFL